MTTDPIQLFLDAFFAIIEAILAPVSDIVSGPYSTWVRETLGSIMQWVVS